MNKVIARAITAAVLMAGGSSAYAASISITPNTATAVQGAGNGTTPTPIQVVYDNTGATADGIEFEITFDNVDLSVAASGQNGASCSVAGNLITVIVFDAGGNTIPSNNFCNLTFTTLAGAATGETKPLTIGNVVFTDGVNALPAPTLNNGVINIIAAPVAAGPVLTYSPATGSTIASGSNITVTPSGGQAGGTSNYSCTPPAGVSVSNNPGTIATGGAAATLNVTCPAGTADASMTCTSTGGGSSVTYNVDCPAAPAPVLTSNPPNGTTLSCNGPAGSTQTTSVVFTNSGNANVTGLTCSTVGAGFSLTTAPSATIAPSATTTATVTCAVPADGAGANTGSLNCSTTSPGGALAYPLTSIAQSSAVPTQAAIVPASSLWSKLGLVGLLAVLGMLVVGFRRQH